MTGMDEFSSGYEEAPGAVAAAVKAYTEMTSCAFKMIHARFPLPTPSPLADLFPRSHEQQLPLQLLHTSENPVAAFKHNWIYR